MSPETKTERMLRLILFLSNSYPKTKEECNSFLGIKDSAFYTYISSLNSAGFNVRQKDGRYRIDYSEKENQVMRNVFHFSEEENYLLSKAIDKLDENINCAARLKQKLTSFLNHEKTVDSYIRKEKSEIVLSLRRAQKEKKQILLINYSSGNSQTIRNRLVEPFEFKDDFNLVWAFDVSMKQNRQFKVLAIAAVASMAVLNISKIQSESNF